MRFAVLAFAVAALAQEVDIGTGQDTPSDDSPRDATPNDAIDAPLDASPNDAIDAPLDATPDDAIDAPLDATPDYAIDAPLDATPVDSVDVPDIAPIDADEAPEDVVTPVPTPEPTPVPTPVPTPAPSSVQWCSTDADCIIFGDSNATCTTNGCECGTEGYGPTFAGDVELPICVLSGQNSFSMIYRLHFLRGAFGNFTAESGENLTRMATSVFNAPFTSYQFREGSITAYGGADVSAETLAASSTDIANRFLAQTLADPSTNAALNLNSLSDMAVTSFFASASTSSCKLAHATQTFLIDGVCTAFVCESTYQPVNNGASCARVKVDRDFDAGEIIGIIFGSIIGCVALLGLVYCCVTCKPMPKADSLQEVKVVEREEPVGITEPAHNPEPEPVKAPEPEPVAAVPEPEPVVVARVPEPEPEPEPEPVVVAPVVVEKKGPTDEEILAAVIKIQRRVRQYLSRLVYLRILQAWKEQESARKSVLTHGKTGSIGCVLEKDNTKVAKIVEGSGAEEAGLVPGDEIVLVQTKGRGGNAVYTPITNKTRWLEAIGAAKEVFEGSIIKIVVFRDPEAKAAFADSKPSAPKPGDKHGTLSWVEAVRNIELREELNVEVKPETEKTRATRIKNFQKIKSDKNIEDMNVELVNSFMSDPVACCEFTRKVYEDADADKSGFLQEEEIKGVFNIMAKHTGCPPVSDATAKRLFYVMDASGDGEVNFEEFYPHFRSYQLKMIHALLFTEEDEVEM